MDAGNLWGKGRWSDCPPSRGAQAISDLRARLSGGYNPGNILANNDQNIIKADGVSPILAPSNGYTFNRIPQGVSHILGSRRGTI